MTTGITTVITTDARGRSLGFSSIVLAAWSRLAGSVWNTLIALIVPALLFILWTVAAQRHWMSEQVLPSPQLVWETARELAGSDLWPNLQISLLRLAGGLLVGTIAGAVLGGVIGLSRRAEAVIYPTFISLVQVPTLAWIPLLIMWLGLGEALKIAVLVKAVIVPITIQTWIGVRDVNPKLKEIARVQRLPAYLTLTHLIIPAALPSFMTGLRLALAQGWTALLAVELLASSEGIGFLMVWGRQLFQLDVVFVCIFVIAIVGLVMDRGFQWLDHALVRWPRPALTERKRNWSRSNVLWQLILPFVIVAVWTAATGFGWVDTRLLPTPASVLSSLQAGLTDGTLSLPLAASLERYALGLAIGVGAALMVGLATGLARPLNRLLSGTLTVLRLVAIFAWLPLLTAWVGLGQAAKITFIAIACFFPMQLATERGIANLSAQLAETAKTLRLRFPQRLRYVVLPGASASMFAGLRLAMVQAWVGTVGAEYFMSSGAGIGSFMINAQQLLRMDLVVSAMVLVGLTAAALAWIGQTIEERATKWRAA